jgi:hypothetical protein
MNSFSVVPFVLVLAIAGPAGARAQDHTHTPGARHAALMKLEGEYLALTKYYWKPGQPPEESRGVTVLKGVLGGRFLLQEDFDAERSGPPSGIRLYGFNAGSGHYEAVWSYTRSTGLLTMSGVETGEPGTIRFRGRWEEAAGKFRPLNATLRLLAPDRFSIELTGEQPEDPRVETVFTRRPPAAR